MNTKALFAIFGLVLLAAFIWLRGTLGMESVSDTLPLLAAFPLYLWLTVPWKWSQQRPEHLPKTVFAGLALTLAGIAGDSTLLLSAGWIAFFDAFQFAFLERIPRRFLILPFLGFPWLTQNLESIGWQIRYTGAAAVQILFTLLGMNVHRDGTMLLVQGLPLSVEPACAGLNVLQSLLIVGGVLICARIPGGWRFWLALCALIPLAWIANTSRIFMLGCAGLLVGPDFARGWFHEWGGWLVLCLMFCLCVKAFNLLTARNRRTA